ncbi:MAG: M48 family metalloprotease [Isosphaeraceae bacterium]
MEARILDLARHAGIEGGRVFEVNKSVDTKTVNAYVIGLFGTHWIVLWDTLLARADDREVLAVMGHEMGHYVLHHVERGVVLSSILVLVGLFWTDRATRALLRRFGLALGRDRPGRCGRDSLASGRSGTRNHGVDADRTGVLPLPGT